MIYAYDKAATIPLVDVYDRQMMLAQVAAAKDMYEKGLEEMKDFRKEYGDLMFSNDAYQNWYNQNFDVSGFVSDLYKNGIDPVRSAEGRSLVSQYINSRKYGDLAKIKQWDANMKAYQESKAKLGDKYDPEFEKWRLNGDPNNWGNRPFTETSAVPYTSLHDMVHPTFAAIKPHLLTPLEAQQKLEKLGGTYDPRNNYIGVTEGDMRRAMEQYLPGVRNSTTYQYQRHLAEQDLIREGNTSPTDKEIDERLVNNAIISDYGISTPLEQKADEWKMAQFDRQTKLQAARESRATTTQSKTDYSFRDDIYERGLKNMLGLDPEYYLGVDKNGSPVTAMELFDNNPEFWNEYSYRVRTSLDPVKMLTHTKGDALKDLPTRMGEKEMTKFGENNDVSGEHFYKMNPSSLGNLISEYELRYKIEDAVRPHTDEKGNPIRLPKPLRPEGKISSEATKSIRSHGAAYTMDTSKGKGIVTAYFDGAVRTVRPITIYYDSSDIDKKLNMYEIMDYRSMPSSGNYATFEEKGISTIYDGRYGMSSQMSSANVDKSMHISPNEMKSVSVDSPY